VPAVSITSNSSWTEDGQRGTAFFFCSLPVRIIMRHQAVHADNGKLLMLV
jgi:hypothetical protein